MSLAIAALDTACRVRARNAGAETHALTGIVDRVARERLGSEIEGCLGPSLDRDDSVVRIRRLNVRLPVAGRAIDPHSLAREWALAFVRELFQALAYPEGHTVVQMRRFPSEAAYVAARLEAIVTASPASLWEFHEFGDESFPSAAEVLLDAVRGEPGLLRAVLMELEAAGKLVPVLSACDDLTIDSLIRTESERSGSAPLEIDFEVLLAIAVAMTRMRPIVRWLLADPRQALRAWALGSRSETRGLNARATLWSLQALAGYQVLNTIRSHGGTGAAEDWIAHRASSYPEPVESILRRIAAMEAAPPAQASATLSTLARLLEDIRPEPYPETPALPGIVVDRIDSDWAGLMLLTGIVLRLDWWRFLSTSGDRAFRHVLYGVACTIASQPFDGHERADPATALFAGVTGEYDRLDFRSFLALTPPSVLSSIGVSAGAWPEAFSQAADLLLVEFLAQVRGFRRSPARFARDQFIHRPGTAWIDATSILVTIAPNSWSPALHLSSVDQTIGAAPWLAPRRLEFRLEGL